MTPTDTILSLEKALEDVRKWHKMKAPTTDGRLDLLRAQRDSLRDFQAACSPLAIRTLLDAHASALRDAAPVSPVVPVEPVTWEVLTLGEWRPTRFPDELRAKGFEVRTALASPPMAQAEPSEDTKRLRAALVGIEPHLPYDWAFTSVMEYIGQTAFQEAVAAVRAAIATLPSTPKEEEVKP